jgi:hypothetical protein
VPILLLVALVVMVVALLALLLFPFSLWARDRSGRARRRAQGWGVRGNAWLFLLSVPLFLAPAWFASHWWPHAGRDAVLGLVAGIALGAFGLLLTRFEHDADGFHFTPNRWVVLALILVIVARIAVGLWLALAPVLGYGTGVAGGWLHGGGWFGIAGLLLGYHGSYAWGLRARLPRRPGP